MAYENVQYGYSMIAVLVIVLLLVVYFVKAQPVALYITAFIVLAVMLNFYKLKVTVDASSVSWEMGVGLINGSIAVNDIKEVTVVESRWVTGWGIRKINNGTLYNVSGFDAVNIALHDGSVIRLGTDKPAELKQAIQTVKSR
ncbi:hypothetical protein [Pseudoalteromonas byunsanensis]|nr:hypothetical protein [Pseudoalteromonas byunsanensis]